MRVISKKKLVEFWTKHDGATSWLKRWHRIVRAAKWKNIQEARKTLPSADGVTVESHKTVTVFNVCGDDYRMVTAIHYNTGLVYVLWLGTHREYDREHWKANL